MIVPGAGRLFGSLEYSNRPNNRAGWNKRVGWTFFRIQINMQRGKDSNKRAGWKDAKKKTPNSLVFQMLIVKYFCV